MDEEIIGEALGRVGGVVIVGDVVAAPEDVPFSVEGKAQIGLGLVIEICRFGGDGLGLDDKATDAAIGVIGPLHEDGGRGVGPFGGAGVD